MTKQLITGAYYDGFCVQTIVKCVQTKFNVVDGDILDFLGL